MQAEAVAATTSNSKGDTATAIMIRSSSLHSPREHRRGKRHGRMHQPVNPSSRTEEGATRSKRWIFRWTSWTGSTVLALFYYLSVHQLACYVLHDTRSITGTAQHNACRYAFGQMMMMVDAASTSSSSRQRRASAASKDPNDYYNILGLDRSASIKQIKSAYRKLALQFHPDKVSDPAEKDAAEEQFVKISEAYSILSDDTKRQVYDKYGKRGLEALERGIDPEAAGFGGFPGGGGGAGGFPGGGGFGGGSGGQTFHFTTQGFGGGSGNQHTFFNGDPFEMFNQFFGSEHFGAAGQGGSGGSFNGGGFPGFDFGARNGNGRPQGGRPFHQGGSQFSSQQKQQQQPLDIFKDMHGVVKLGSAKFPDSSSKFLWLIIFYSNDSQGSVETKAQIELLAGKVKGTFKIGAVDCSATRPREQRFCQQKSIKLDQLPQFGFVVNGNLDLYDDISPEGQRGTSIPSAKALHEFATDHFPKALIQNVNHAAQVEERLLEPVRKSRKGPLAAVLLLTDKYETSSMYISLAYQFRDSFRFGESRAKNLSLAKEFGVKKYPLLLTLIPRPSKRGSTNAGSPTYETHIYRGDMTLDAISNWLNKEARAI